MIKKKDTTREGVYTWEQAYNIANDSFYLNQRGYLANINTPQEHNFLLNHIALNKYYFFGATDNSSMGIIFFFLLLLLLLFLQHNFYCLFVC